VLLELLRAACFAGLPVGLASYALVWWSLRHGYLDAAGSVRDVEQGFKQISKQNSAERKRRKAARKNRDGGATEPAQAAAAPAMNPVHRKWLAFGGGFYGVVGLLTYAVVELGELRDFFLGFESLADLIRRFGFDMLVGLLVNALTNFIVAIAWPVYWMSDIRSNHLWAWFVMAYAGYWAGARYALHRLAGSAPAQPGPERG